MWIGNSTDEDVDKYYKRRDANKRNLDDLINYLEHVKDTGFPAVRMEVEQEEHWAQLLRNLLIEKIIKDVRVQLDVNRVDYTCSKCEQQVEANFKFTNGNNEEYEFEYMRHCDCGISKKRSSDIENYIMSNRMSWLISSRTLD